MFWYVYLTKWIIIIIIIIIIITIITIIIKIIIIIIIIIIMLQLHTTKGVHSSLSYMLNVNLFPSFVNLGGTIGFLNLRTLS